LPLRGKIKPKYVFEERITENLFPSVSLILVPAQTSQNKRLHVRTHLNLWGEHDFPNCYLSLVPLKSVLGESPRDCAYHHLINDHSERPYITFISVFLLLQNLRSHIRGSSHYTDTRVVEG
jgi:hypothetical protein